ncbi:MAG: 1-phosphofructokinase family hexose kinase [Firmicutes bacterium]|nr:1-phosphofructokinase family hexose kinase [Bacillota bacterium]
MILTVTVNPALDKNYLVSALSLSGINRVKEMSVLPAGKGLNVSRVLHALETPTLATGILGGYTGKQIEAALRLVGLPYDFVWTRSESRLSLLIVDDDGKVHSEIIEPGPKLPAGIWKRLATKVSKLASQCSWVVLSGSPTPDAEPDLYYHLINQVYALGTKVVLDTREPWLREGIKAKPDLIKPNWEEFQELVGPCFSTVQAVQEARKLVAKGVGTVVVSMGAKGAFAVDERDAYIVQELPAIDVVSPVGCGDSLVAGLLAKLHAGESFADAFRFGVAVATSNAAHLGAGLFDLQQVEELASKIVVEKNSV